MSGHDSMGAMETANGEMDGAMHRHAVGKIVRTCESRDNRMKTTKRNRKELSPYANQSMKSSQYPHVLSHRHAYRFAQVAVALRHKRAFGHRVVFERQLLVVQQRKGERKVGGPHGLDVSAAKKIIHMNGT